jgi:hypothetical protein
MIGVLIKMGNVDTDKNIHKEGWYKDTGSRWPQTKDYGKHFPNAHNEILQRTN